MTSKAESDKVTYNDLLSYEYRHLLCASHGRRENKSSESIIKGKNIKFQVIDHGETILVTDRLTEAVDKYNDIKPRANR